MRALLQVLSQTLRNVFFLCSSFLVLYALWFILSTDCLYHFLYPAVWALFTQEAEAAQTDDAAFSSPSKEAAEAPDMFAYKQAVSVILRWSASSRIHNSKWPECPQVRPVQRLCYLLFEISLVAPGQF